MCGMSVLLSRLLVVSMPCLIDNEGMQVADIVRRENISETCHSQRRQSAAAHDGIERLQRADAPVQSSQVRRDCCRTEGMALGAPCIEERAARRDLPACSR